MRRSTCLRSSCRVLKTLRMVVRGRAGFAEWKKTMERAEQLNVTRRIVDLDAVSDETLRTLHKRSGVFASIAV